MADEEHVEMLKRGVLAWNTWRAENPRLVPDLDGVNLGSDFPVLHVLDLRGIDFHSVTMRKGYLHDVDLTWADMRYSNLWQANARSCRFDECDFSFARVDYARFDDASFRRAAFEWTKFGHAVFRDVDFGGATGLDGNQIWAVTIDPLTLDRTSASLVETPELAEEVERFYRKAELPEHIIEYYRARIGMTPPYLSVFISYSSADRDFARALHGHLTSDGVRCTLDEVDFQIGEDVHSEIRKATRHMDRMLLCCSQNSLRSPWVDDEITMALAVERERTRNGRDDVFLLPLMLDDYLLAEYDDAKADLLRARVAANFTHWSKLSFLGGEYDRLLAALRRRSSR
ncbi:MAG TPA: toll/interleukin-1 receptor domain-containing protein [Pyrinomonadaceae bacterium]|nr:toll/interleukin-1 receptor domain-containing protein [Pyrinomonadaceae bacterium]